MNPDRENPTWATAPAPAEDIMREPTKEEIIEDIRQGLRDVLAGEEGMPARESIAALRQRIYGDANNR
ncbi:MAG: hypothetical protein OXI34_16105 [Chloroflexota bacterium]|nr:hypothetical protein [Chloroflexota bacterium]MDE2945523.1 hypothetical protein [Chloroflexota bacterium]